MNNLNAVGIINGLDPSFKYIQKGSAMTQFIILFLVPFIAWKIFLHRLGHEVSVVKSIRIYGILTVLNLLVVKFVVWSMVKTLKIYLEPESIWCLLIAVFGAIILPFVGEIFRKYSGIRVEINARKREKHLEKKDIDHLKEEGTVQPRADVFQDVGESMPEMPADHGAAPSVEDKQVIIKSAKAATLGVQTDAIKFQEVMPEKSAEKKQPEEQDGKGDYADGEAVETDPKADKSAEDETILG